jgi:hypothetical protein
MSKHGTGNTRARAVFAYLVIIAVMVEGKVFNPKKADLQ